MAAGQEGAPSCHYISRFLTKPWEHSDRRLSWFDFTTDSFGQSSSRTLFSRDGLNSVAVERRLSALVETPLAAAHLQLAQADPAVLARPAIVRALTLALLMQGVRTHAALADPMTGKELEDLVRADEEKLEAIVRGFHEDNVMAVMRSPGGGLLYYPGVGLFPMLVGRSALRIGLAMPLGQTSYVLVARRPMEIADLLFEASLTGGPVARSVGMGPNAARIVIPPAALSRRSDPEYRRFLHTQRAANEACVRAVEELARLEEQALRLVLG